MPIVQPKTRGREATTDYTKPLVALGTIGGAIAGGMIGSAAAPGAGTAVGATAGAEKGALLGAIATGASLGSTGGSLLGYGIDESSKKNAGPGPVVSPTASAQQSQSAMQRRLAYFDNGDPSAQLAAAQDSLKLLPQHLQDQYGPTLAEAMARAQRQRAGEYA